MSGSYYVDSSNRGNVNELLDQAELYRDQALQYSNDAAASAISADTSEANALSSANTAAASASAASTSQANAASSASAASSSEANASSFADSASSFATDAGVARDAAVVAKNDAQTAATNAAASATQASNVLSSSLLKANNLSDLQSVSAAKTNLGLNNVDNTSDVNKPISTAQAAGLVSKDSSTGSAQLPAGTTAQRSPNGVGKMRYNTDLGRAEVNNGASWDQLGGDVVGPSSSTDNALVRFNSTTGKIVKNSSATLNDSGELSVSALQVGQSGTASNNFHWRNLLDGLLRLSRGNAGTPITDVMRVKANNSVEFPGGVSSGRANTDVTASRAFGTTYTNSTVNDIEVRVVVVQGSNGVIQAVVAGVVSAAMQLSATSNYATITFTVPAGSTYALNVTAGTMTMQRWTELR